MKVAIIDYGSGNIHSISKAVGLYTKDYIVTKDPDVISNAEHVILPGVGAFGDCANGIKAIDGLEAAIEDYCLNLKKPFLGICVGMQLLAEKGYENGEHEGFGFIKNSSVEKLDVKNLNIPHIAWNEVKQQKQSPLFRNINDLADFYFVHSYAMNNNPYITATCDYGISFPCALQKDNIFGVQFHPEKSSNNGLKLIENFLSL